MISIEEIDKTILELESKDTSFAVIERLSWLYTVRDHIKPADKITDVYTGSEFCEACSGASFDHIMQVLSEHMECIKTLYPKEYTSLINKINSKKFL